MCFEGNLGVCLSQFFCVCVKCAYAPWKRYVLAELPAAEVPLSYCPSVIAASSRPRALPWSWRLLPPFARLRGRETDSLRRSQQCHSRAGVHRSKKLFRFFIKNSAFAIEFSWGFFFSSFCHDFLLEETYFLAVQIINFVSPTPHLVSAVWPHMNYWFWVWQSLVHHRLYTMNSQIDLGSSREWQTSNVLPEQVQL